mmetsp:Transcript_2404/g.4034  ORF Transcript_2404/g.4034 Transcript_2404/m.4034 type:complete len:211 (+) Transcript_2404:130-762(+)|eukprot:CAMPEP_0119101608 /NCGR_PEP_ID=MMETSP1180-20130426/620_1 /TAXON_ID=3052 ORGANISM="Chlamydomonas cf sp, Strain CCMP681" /NCGR_SAMPLE_ID=MMETSP1180 /ASSEMBLY_ACC=CAM_ASM_000741 /LENGTH=210 /DNA_ID=CAMNT_0007085755 /DNA_START=118 /DNA_END=750 /DNA_ORIENTATION=+
MAAQVVQAVAAIASHMERNLDAELQKLDNLGDEDLDQIRADRMQAIRTRQHKSKEWLAKGHGEYTEVFTEQEFFKAMKGEEKMICHFFRENWPCKVMDKHMAILSKRHIETKFIKINAEKSPFLTEKLKIWMLPTLALIKNEKVEDYVVGFRELGNQDDFETELLEQRLARSEIIDHDTQMMKPKAMAGPSRALRKGGQRTASDEDSDLE